MMKYLKKILMGFAAIIFSMQSNAQNLPGRTHNLNLFCANEYMSTDASADQNGSHNVLRDMACDCDNLDGGLTIKIHIKYSALLDQLANEMGDLDNFEKLVDNPVIKASAKAYAKKLLSEAVHGGLAFIDDNLKEMLSSRDQDGKTVFDILQEKEKSGKKGCVLLKKIFERMEQEIQMREEIQRERLKLADMIHKLVD